MKNTNCKNCGMSISEKAPTCPRCGHPNKKQRRFLKIGALIFLTLMIIGWLAGRVSTSSPNTPSISSKTGYTLNDREQAVLTFLLVDNFATYGKGGDAIADSLANWEAPIRISADEIQRDYERNEVSADKTYRSRPIIVSGRISSIDRSLGENYSISLQGGDNMFMSPRASMADGFTEYLASLNKGQEVYLACKGDGMLIGSAILKDCQPIENWADIEARNYLQNLSENLGNNNQNARLIVLFSMAITPLLEPESPCFMESKNAGCDAEINKATKKFNRKSFFDAGQKLNMDTTSVANLIRKSKI
jgi:hypothetical protein